MYLSLQVLLFIEESGLPEPVGKLFLLSPSDSWLPSPALPHPPLQQDPRPPSPTTPPQTTHLGPQLQSIRGRPWGRKEHYRNYIIVLCDVPQLDSFPRLKILDLSGNSSLVVTEESAKKIRCHNKLAELCNILCLFLLKSPH